MSPTEKSEEVQTHRLNPGEAGLGGGVRRHDVVEAHHFHHRAMRGRERDACSLGGRRHADAVADGCLGVPLHSREPSGPAVRAAGGGAPDPVPGPFGQCPHHELEDVGGEAHGARVVVALNRLGNGDAPVLEQILGRKVVGRGDAPGLLHGDLQADGPELLHGLPPQADDLAEFGVWSVQLKKVRGIEPRLHRACAGQVLPGAEPCIGELQCVEIHGHSLAPWGSRLRPLICVVDNFIRTTLLIHTEHNGVMELFNRLDPVILEGLNEALGHRADVLAHGMGEGVVLVGTRAHLARRVGDTWRVWGWEEVGSGSWIGEADMFRWRTVEGERFEAQLTDPGRLPELFQERVQASTVVQSVVDGTRGQVQIVGRRSLGENPKLHWYAVPAGGADLEDPATRAAVVAETDRLATEYF